MRWRPAATGRAAGAAGLGEPVRGSLFPRTRVAGVSFAAWQRERVARGDGGRRRSPSSGALAPGAAPEFSSSVLVANAGGERLATFAGAGDGRLRSAFFALPRRRGVRGGSAQLGRRRRATGWRNCSLGPPSALLFALGAAFTGGIRGRDAGARRRRRAGASTSTLAKFRSTAADRQAPTSPRPRVEAEPRLPDLYVRRLGHTASQLACFLCHVTVVFRNHLQGFGPGFDRGAQGGGWHSSP